MKLYILPKFPFSRFVVNEESMMPAFKPGDHVLTFSWARISRGDVIVFTALHTLSLRGVKRRSNLNQSIKRLHRGVYPDLRGGACNDKAKDMEGERVYFIKRVDRIAGDLIYVSGDNKQDLRFSSFDTFDSLSASKLGTAGLNNRSVKTFSIKRNQIVGKVILKY